MASEDIELLDRRFAFLDGLDGGAFVRELARLIELLEADSRFGAHLADLGREAEDAVRQLAQDDSRLVAEAVRLRDHLIRVAPDSDDSDLPQLGDDQPDPNGALTFSWFNRRLAAEHVLRPTTFGMKVENKASALLICVKAKTERVDVGGRNEVRQIDDEVRAAFREQDRVQARFVDWRLTSPAVSLIAIKNLVFLALDPTGVIRDNLGHARFGFSVGVELGRLEFDLRKPDPAPDSKAGTELSREVEKLRRHAKRVHEELRLRVGARASMVALFDRFKHRSEWHDRQRLAEMADRNVPGKKAQRREELLTAELARWLFDNGLNPLSTPVMADLRPDLVDPTQPFNLYVEAKQYADGAKPYLIKGFRQVWDTVAGIQTTPYRVREAFFVIFRRGGPRYVFPKTVAGDGWTTHIIVIDIASTAERGSQGASEVVRITEAELLSPQSSGKPKKPRLKNTKR